MSTPESAGSKLFPKKIKGLGKHISSLPGIKKAGKAETGDVWASNKPRVIGDSDCQAPRTNPVSSVYATYDKKDYSGVRAKRKF